MYDQEGVIWPYLIKKVSLTPKVIIALVKVAPVPTAMVNLYTRSNKRGDIDRILNLFVKFGADEKILYQSHPHIGTNKLPQIITAMRQQIIDCGGEFLFEKKVIDLNIENGKIKSVKTADGESF